MGLISSRVARVACIVIGPSVSQQQFVRVEMKEGVEGMEQTERKR